jgi:hypothetical protein
VAVVGHNDGSRAIAAEEERAGLVGLGPGSGESCRRQGEVRRGDRREAGPSGGQSGEFDGPLCKVANVFRDKVSFFAACPG